MSEDLETRGIDVIRGLALDAVKAANSGHTGTAMALAPLAHVLWTRTMTYDASAPGWPDRDRLVLSCGHASMLLYSMLHLTGHGLELDDLRSFRQWSSATPGHPEVGHTCGVEVTTGPLGQGIANAVGMAVAEANLRARFGTDLFDHRTYAICSDGDLMEGISHESASLAGHLGLGRLTAVYDDNRITIDGETGLALSDDAAARFEALGWHVIDIGDAANELDRIEAALDDASAVTDRPSLVIIRTHIGFGLPTQQDTPEAHGAITGDDEIAGAKRNLGLDPEATFQVPADVFDMYRTAGRRGQSARESWTERHQSRSSEPEVAAVLAGSGIAGWHDQLPSFEQGQSLATRQASAAALSSLVDAVPSLISGSADLTGNTGTKLGAEPLTASDPGGRQLYYGVREHAMAAMANGMALHGGVRPVVGTFLVFSDYMRPAVRLAALSGARAIFVWSHDSVGVGEDGPTHQPVEHVSSLRAIPGLVVLRPADANETARAWRFAIEHEGPVALITTRQGVPTLAGTIDAPVERGGYVIHEGDGDPDLVLIGTGSEVQWCLEAADELSSDGHGVRVVSLPSWELFDAQPPEYQRSVLPPGTPTISVEAGVTHGWHRFADTTIGIDRFGASAPGGEVMERLGISTPSVVATARARLADG